VFKGPHIQGSADELSAIEKSIGETIIVDVEDVVATTGE